MTTEEIAQTISIGLDPNGETAKVIIAKLQKADELAESVFDAVLKGSRNVGRNECAEMYACAMVYVNVGIDK